jgi:hypothetical protein
MSAVGGFANRSEEVFVEKIGTTEFMSFARLWLVGENMQLKIFHKVFYAI